MSIVFDRVTKSFGSKTVLKEVSFKVHTGEILFILGKSGMGKSVTLKNIVGILKPDAGRVLVDGTNVAELNASSLAEIRKKCGMVFQHPALLDSLTVFENVAFGLKETLPEIKKKEIVLSKLALVQLNPDILDQYPPEISYGMQKRVSLARTIAPDPKYLLFDEPTTGLDPITTRAINELIFDLSRELKVTSVVVSHDMSCALKIADRILVLDQGRVLTQGTTLEIQASKEPLIQDFLSETVIEGSPR